MEAALGRDAADASTATRAMTKAEITKGHLTLLDWAKGIVKRAVEAGAREMLMEEVEAGLKADPAPYPTFNGKGLAYKVACLAFASPAFRKTLCRDMDRVDGVGKSSDDSDIE